MLLTKSEIEKRKNRQARKNTCYKQLADLNERLKKGKITKSKAKAIFEAIQDRYRDVL